MSLGLVFDTNPKRQAACQAGQRGLLVIFSCCSISVLFLFSVWGKCFFKSKLEDILMLELQRVVKE